MKSILIIGAGFSGLSAAHFLKKIRPDTRITILEKSNCVGGTIQTFRKDGFTAEWGAHGFLDNCAETNELLADLSLAEKTLWAPLRDFSRYICLRGKLRKIPQSPPAVIISNLIRPWHKLRVLADLWKKPAPLEQTIAQWVTHRFGKAILPFADAAATGTYAGDIENLCIDAVMPGLREIEKKHGSIIRGLLKNRGAHKSRKTLPSMISFETGMESLCTALATDLDIQFNQIVQEIQRSSGGWKIVTDRSIHSAQHVIVAININAALPLLDQLAPTPVKKIPEAHLANVVLGFDASISIPHAFGYLAPEQEKRFGLGVLFSSKMFPHRAPPGHVLLETLVGGRRHPERCDLNDSELIQGVLFDLNELLGITTEPLFTHVLRPTAGIPQLELGHPRLWAYKNNLEAQFSGLSILGFGWHGIGINDMTKEAKRVAEKIYGQSGAATESLKKVYF